MSDRTMTALYSARFRPPPCGPRCAEAEGTRRSPGAAPHVQLQIASGLLLPAGRATPPRVHATHLERDGAHRNSRCVQDAAVHIGCEARNCQGNGFAKGILLLAISAFNGCNSIPPYPLHRVKLARDTA
jgi:hypothetical protein